MFADDTYLYHKSSDVSLLNEAINEDLTHLDNWLKGHKFSLYFMKTHFMLISTKPKLNPEPRKSHGSTAVSRRKVSYFFARFEEDTSNFIKNLA